MEDILTGILSVICFVFLAVVIVTGLTPKRWWLRVNPDAIPEVTSRLWIFSYPYWTLNRYGKGACVIFFLSGSLGFIVPLVGYFFF